MKIDNTMQYSTTQTQIHDQSYLLLRQPGWIIITELVEKPARAVFWALHPTCAARKAGNCNLEYLMLKWSLDVHSRATNASALKGFAKLVSESEWWWDKQACLRLWYILFTNFGAILDVFRTLNTSNLYLPHADWVSYHIKNALRKHFLKT